MFTRILVPYDFSAPSAAALAHARILAHRVGASVHLLHVVEDHLVTGPFGTEMYVPQTAGTLAHLTGEARARLEQVLAAEEVRQPRPTGEVIVGVAARTIVEFASDNGYDLIVMGTHGRSGITHFVMGSVAEHVVRTARCPVLTVHTSPAAEVIGAPSRRLTATA